MVFEFYTLFEGGGGGGSKILKWENPEGLELVSDEEFTSRHQVSAEGLRELATAHGYDYQHVESGSDTADVMEDKN